MFNEKETTRRVNIILASLRSFKDMVVLKNPGFKLRKINTLYKALEIEVSKQGFSLIELSKIPPKPRTAAEIIADIAKSERLSPEILDEIKRSIAP